MQVKALALDVDGTCTDCMRILSTNGIEYKRFNIKDIEALMNWISSGNLVFFITGDPGFIAKKFAKYIGLSESVVYAETKDRKVQIINELCKKNGLKLGEIAYIGDDINDFGALEHVIEQNGIAACPANAVPLLKSCTGIIKLKASGGNGAVAEFIGML
jgi:YrbI family 3-deoxy-D-manno-octulosonate 8-phosphate phosphatase